MRISDWSSDVCSSDLFHKDRNSFAACGGMKVSIGRVRASSTKATMMAKAPKTTKAPKAGASSKAKPKAARKPAAPKKAKKEDTAPEHVFHNETRRFRSEARSVGKERVSTFRTRRS